MQLSVSVEPEPPELVPPELVGWVAEGDDVAVFVPPDEELPPDDAGAVPVLVAEVPDEVLDGAIQVEPEAGCVAAPEVVESDDVDAPDLSDSEDVSESLALIGISDDARRSLLDCVD